MIEIDIKGKLVSKKNKMKVFRNRLYKTQEVKDFEKFVAEEALNQMKDKNLMMTKKPLVMELQVWFGDQRKRDLQNCFDTICDALEGIVYEDDSQIVSLSGSKFYEKDVWKIKIIINFQ